MTTRCKPGDLAIIMYDEPQCAANIGRLVEVSGPLAIDVSGKATWLIQPITPEPYLINTWYDDSVRFMDYQEQGIEHPDEWMLPVGTEPEHETVEQREDAPVEID